MQCIWKSLARFPQNACSRVPIFFSNARPVISWASPHDRALSLSKTTANTFQNLCTATLHSRSSSLPPVGSPSPSTLTSTWTPPSRLALSATKAVHVSLRQHALEDAFIIVNTIRYAALPAAERENGAWDKIKRSEVAVPPGVSPRLPAHALLHGLVRIGLQQQASHLATSMMTNGIRVRGRTLERIMEGFYNAATVKNFASQAGDAQLKSHMEDILGTEKVLSLDPSMTSDPNTVFALKLLNAARKSRSQRTSALYNMLITLCLINGEIIIASLLFGSLVKFWEHRSKTLSQVTSHATSDIPAEPSQHHSDSPKELYLDELLHPTPMMLAAIVRSIRQRLVLATPNAIEDPNLQEALQALAILATMLKDRQLPFSDISGLVRALYQCPRVKNWVWVKRNKSRVCVPAYQYFHQILSDFIMSLPTHRLQTQTSIFHQGKLRSVDFKPRHPVQGMLSPLNLVSYNALLHYALRQRFSPLLANEIYEHMTTKREPPLGTSVCTFNLFLRSAALFRQRHVASDAVQVLSTYTPIDVWKQVTPNKPKLWNLRRNMKHAGRREIQLPPAPAIEQILGDRYTLSTYLSTLISCGQPQVVVHLMRSLLPVFQLKPPPPRYAPPDPERKLKWEESVRRAAMFGPYVLCVFLQALVKTGITKQVHLLFKLIVRASCYSQHPAMISKQQAWHVSVPIYTAMLHAYRTEFHRCRRRVGIRILDYLLRKTNELYQMAKADVVQNVGAGTVDARFYNALLKILAEFLPTKHRTIKGARRHLEDVRIRYATTGSFDARGRVPLLEEVVADMSAHGYPIPIGFHYLFVNEGAGILSSSRDVPELDRRPFAFSEFRGLGTAYTLPVLNTKSLYLIDKNRFRPCRSRTSDAVIK